MHSSVIKKKESFIWDSRRVVREWRTMFLENMSFFYLHIGWLMLGLYSSFGALPDFSRCHDLAISQKFYTDHILRICLDWQIWAISLTIMEKFQLQVDCILYPQCRVRTRKRSRNVFWVKWMEKKYPLRFRTLMYLNLIGIKDILVVSLVQLTMENVSNLGWKVSKRDDECLRLDPVASHSHKAWQAHDAYPPSPLPPVSLQPVGAGSTPNRMMPLPPIAILSSPLAVGSP